MPSSPATSSQRFPRPLAITRRELLRGAALSAGGLLIGLHLPAKTARGQSAVNMPLVARMNAWLHIGRDDRIAFLLDRSEMGQGVHTGLATLIAEELDVDPLHVLIRNAPADTAYRNVYLVKNMLTGGKAEQLSGLPLWAIEKLGRLVGQQVTGGSTSIRGGFEQMRRAGAEARIRLVQAAAAQWQVPPGECTTADGIITHEPTGQSLSYGAVADAAARLAPPDDIPLRPRSAWRLIGRHDARVDTEAKVSGNAIFGLDIRRQDQLFAAVQWAPHFGATVKALDPSAALAQTGIKAVVPLGRGFAVVADNSWRAMQACSAVKVEWSAGPESGFDDAALWNHLRAVIGGDGKIVHDSGNVDKALGSAAKVITAEYRLPFLAHATMEPMNATALVDPDGVDIWVPTQAQEAAQKAAAKATGVSEDRIRIHTTYLGGGFGRRTEADFVTAAAEVAKAVTGRPVQVMWPREQDMRHDFYRPAALHRVKIGLDGDGKLIAWRQDLASPSIMSRVFPPTTWLGPDETSIEGSLDGIYAIPNTALKYVVAETPVPVGFWRSVGHSHNAFVKECMIDEAAQVANQDPLAYRRRLLASHPRHQAVLDLAAAKAGWNTPLAQGHGRGIALHESFGTIVAMVAEVSVNGSEIEIHRIICAADAGTVINPAIAVAQLTGGAIFGLTAALYGRVTLQGGAVQEGNFNSYRMLRMADASPVEVFMVESDAAPGGLGEPGVPPAAPALANAVFAATGKRRRELPLILS